MSEQVNYREEAFNDAKTFIEEFEDQIIERIRDTGEASDDYNNDYDGGDGFFHSSFVDKDYCLLEAAELLDQLDEYEETDNGLWEGRPPREALSAQAAYTYGNAVAENIRELIAQINERVHDLGTAKTPSIRQLKEIITYILKQD